MVVDLGAEPCLQRDPIGGAGESGVALVEVFAPSGL